MKVKVLSQTDNRILVNQQPAIQVISVGVQGPTGPIGPSGPNTISTAADVDTTDLKDGSLLVFKSVAQKWTSTTTLDAQNMDGGEF